MVASALATALLTLSTGATGQDPAQGEVPLPACEGWEARLVLDTGGEGVWTVGTHGVFPQYASDEVVALGDVDPRVDGRELYVGGEGGNLYQLVAYPHGGLDARLVAHFPGQEIHTLAYLPAEAPGEDRDSSLLVFTAPGALALVTPTGPHGRFEVRDLGPTPSRVRDARTIPTANGPRVVTAGREGRLGLLHLGPDGPEWSTIHSEPMGFGRVAVRRPTSDPLVLYSTLDDGRVLRHEQHGNGWSTETIYAGPQGPRGVASGRFDADPDVETVAVFGYSGRVELLTRGTNGRWSVETIFEDTDRGHWLSAAELDGRNATDELIGSGYGARVFMLTRPPGYGRSELATGSEPATSTLVATDSK